VEHLKRFGLSRDPFSNEPHLDFWFETEGAAQARQRLVRCLRQGKELCVLVGEVGAGTTTLARVVLEDLEPERFEVAMLVVGRAVEPAWLRAAVARQLGVAEPATGRSDAMRQLYERLVEIREQGRRAVLAIDEAHGLAGSDALAELLALLNFEADEARLLSAVLIGPPELERALAHEPGLLGRVELRVRLAALGAEEARAYLAHRIAIAGGDPGILPPAVMDAIAERATGLPRRMNALADATLFETHLARRPRPTVVDVERAARDLPWCQSSAETLSGISPAALGLEEREAKPDAAEVADPDEDTLDRRTRLAASAALAGVGAPDLVPDGDPGERTIARRPSVPLDVTLREEEMDAEVEAATTGPGHTAPGAWRRAEPADGTQEPEEAGALPDEAEIDGLFVDLVDEEPAPRRRR
jgi:general secretion pathway protein A